MNKKIVIPALLALVGLGTLFIPRKKVLSSLDKEENTEPEREDEAAARARIAREYAAEQGRKGAQKRWAKKKAESQGPVNDGAGVQS